MAKLAVFLITPVDAAVPIRAAAAKKAISGLVPSGKATDIPSYTTFLIATAPRTAGHA